ncbi:MAG: hypothetical protein C0622_02260 [Desulfuromonas sp.]|nr:MAG: hypothetical protein C0622_02260 [Desulfuromonas sp.]
MKLSINLASRRYVNQRAMQMVFILLVLALVAILLLQGNSLLQDYQLSQSYRTHLAELQKELKGTLPERLSPAEIAERRLLYEQADVLLTRDSFRWTVLFDKMEKLTPDGVSYQGFTPDYEKSNLKVSGVAKDLAALQSLLDNLYAAGFDQVYLRNKGESSVDDGRGGKRLALTFSLDVEGVF